ncbi:MAG: V-type ATP synthase subunit D [Spirochaetaceae bacterium]|nr:MAG: V-type ATP synthase subunit D [Spirochaetaceae bacterium]
MGKIKFTKNELKSQKDALKRFLRYLPTLMLKKQQLQMEIRKIEAQQTELRSNRQDRYREILRWIAVFGEDVAFPTLLTVESLDTEIGNIAGVDIPVFRNIEFEESPYDLFALPLWVDEAIQRVKYLCTLDAKIHVLEKQAELLGEELRITSQRVNLFEKVKIPETRENIRIIQIYLGDEQTAAVVRGKIAKKKLVRVSL